MHQRIGWTALRLLLIWIVIYWLVACTETNLALPGAGAAVLPAPAASMTDADFAGIGKDFVPPSITPGVGDPFGRNAGSLVARVVPGKGRAGVAGARNVRDVNRDGADDLIGITSGIVVVVYGTPLESV